MPPTIKTFAQQKSYEESTPGQLSDQAGKLLAAGSNEINSSFGSI